MVLVARQLKQRAFVAGAEVRLAGDVLINESLDALCRVAEFQLASRPEIEPAEGDDVVIWLADVDSSEQQALFGGTVNAIEVNSYPWSMVLRCTDQLELLRRVPQNDHDLSGLTEGAAWMEVADACQVDYDPADIADSGYTFSASLDLWWPAGVPGAQLIQELDSVFGYVTQTVGDDRVVRFRYDLPPSDATGKYRDYERGADEDWQLHGYAHGDRDQIRNFWSVTGYQYPCGADSACTCTPWARAVGTNPQLNTRRTRVGEQNIASDFIQDEALAEHIVRREMRRTNRAPAMATVVALQDPSVHPGTKIGLIDTTYGITTGAVRLGTVTAVDRTGLTMTLTAFTGDPGSEGTVTTGVEKVCNDTHTDIDNPGGFTPPDFDFPPIQPGVAFDPIELIPVGIVPLTPEESEPDGGGGGGAGPVDAVWENVVGGDDFTINGNDVRAEESLNPVARTTNTIAAVSGMPKSYTASWIFRAQNSGILGDNIEILAEDANDVNSYHFWLSFFQNSTGIYFLNGADYEGYGSGVGHDFGDPAPTATDISVTVEWDRPTETFTVTVEGGTGSPFTEDIPTASGVSLAMTSGEVRFVAIANNGSSGDYSEVRDFVWEELE